MLNSASAKDTRITVTFSISALPTGGSGLYLDFALRRQANGDTYYAKVRIFPGGAVGLSFSRIRNNMQTLVGGEAILKPKLVGGARFSVEALVTGDSNVLLQARAWPVGATVPTTWQQTAQDVAAGRLVKAGTIGLWAYLSAGAKAALGVRLHSLAAYTWADPLKPTTPPTSQSTKASSSQPAPTTTAATTSIANSTTTPTTPAATTPPPTTPPVTPGAGTSGAAALGSTDYPIPSGAVFVAANGDDSGPGSVAAPLRTLAHAISVAPNSGTVVLRGGTYHESVEVPSNKALTIQSYPGEVVWLDGSTVVAGWRQSGRTWVHDGWNAQFDSTAGYTKGAAPSGPNWSFVNPSYPMAAHPDQAWRDGTALRQVASAAEVVSGTFYVDYAAHQLVLGDDPNSHEVRATDLPVALTLRSSHSTVRGIGIHRYATAIPDIAMLRLTGSYDTAENVIVSESGSAGLAVIGANGTVSNVTTESNALLGIHASYADGLMVTGVLAQNNNTEHFNYSPVSGGIKVGRSRGVVISHSDFRNNLGTGVWLDESVYNANVTSSTMAGNASHGLSFEISSTGILADNVVTGNGADGFKINNTDRVKIWNNQISDNARNVEVVQDARRGATLSDAGHDPRQKLPDPTMPWIISNVQLMNNIIGKPSAGSYELYAYDYSGQYTAPQMLAGVDGNRFTKIAPGAEIVWGIGGGKSSIFTTVSAFASATGQGSSNTELDGTPGSHPAAEAAAPLPLPGDVAVAIGQPVGTRHLGNF
jgi:hypothetical protein